MYPGRLLLGTGCDCASSLKCETGFTNDGRSPRKNGWTASRVATRLTACCAAELIGALACDDGGSTGVPNGHDRKPSARLQHVQECLPQSMTLTRCLTLAIPALPAFSSHAPIERPECCSPLARHTSPLSSRGFFP